MNFFPSVLKQARLRKYAEGAVKTTTSPGNFLLYPGLTCKARKRWCRKGRQCHAPGIVALPTQAKCSSLPFAAGSEFTERAVPCSASSQPLIGKPS